MASCCDLALCLKDDPRDFGLRVGRDSKGLFTSEVRAAMVILLTGWGRTRATIKLRHCMGTVSSLVTRPFRERIDLRHPQIYTFAEGSENQTKVIVIDGYNLVSKRLDKYVLTLSDRIVRLLR